MNKSLEQQARKIQVMIMNQRHINMAEDILKKKIDKLYNVSGELQSHPYSRLVRVKFFEFAPNITWPLCVLTSDGVKVKWNKVKHSPTEWQQHLHDISPLILARCNYQPRCIVRAMRRIDAAIRWCEKRIEGLNRHYQQILEQQKDAVKKIEAEFVMQKLREE